IDGTNADHTHSSERQAHPLSVWVRRNISKRPRELAERERLAGQLSARRCLRALADYRLLHRVLFGCLLRRLLLLLARGGLGRVRLGKKYLLTVGRRLHLLLLVIASKRCRGNGEAKRDRQGQFTHHVESSFQNEVREPTHAARRL